MISYASNLTIARQCELLDLNRSSLLCRYYLHKVKARFVYLVAIMDWYSRYI
ncbi:hypothetical protein RHORCCE3_2282 [Rickettsia hoogstraalii str. RCCE3]|nr:hypothetical protein RHORCCE3_2282 [Rickettsia hoogstraalii str. RCCE3]